MTVKLEKDKTKAPLDLLPYAFLKAVADVRRHGDEKYGPLENLPRRAAREMVAAMIRHCYEYLAGSDKDHDSGLHPLAHVACGVAVVMYQLEQGKLVDDRARSAKSNTVLSKAVDPHTKYTFKRAHNNVERSSTFPGYDYVVVRAINSNETGLAHISGLAHIYFMPGFLGMWTGGRALDEIPCTAKLREVQNGIELWFVTE